MSKITEFAERLQGFPARLEVELRGVGERAATHGVELARQNVRQRLGKRPTGRLAASIRGQSTATGGALEIALSTDDKKAPAHEYGATIRAKRAFLDVPGGPYLAIPVGPGKNRPGFRGLVLVKGPGGFALAKPNARGRLVTHYVLRKQVVLPARPFLRPALEELRTRFLPDEMRRAVERAVERGR